jgi:hypothetical protein
LTTVVIFAIIGFVIPHMLKGDIIRSDMAKKKKSNRRKKEEEVTERSVFWPMAGGILLCVVALFLLFGGFGTGGPLPKGMFNGAYWYILHS